MLFRSFHTVGLDVERHVGGVQEVVREVFLDDVAFVAETDHEIVDSVMGVDFHDVPQDGLAANFDHRLGLQVRLFTYASAKPARENDCFHVGI